MKTSSLRGLTRFAILTLLSSSVFQPLRGSCGIVSTHSTVGHCQHDTDVAYGPGYFSFRLDHTVRTTTTNGETYRLMVQNFLIGTRFDGIEQIGCQEPVITDYRNEPQGPPEGSMIDLLYGNVRSWLNSRERKKEPSENRRIIRTPAAVVGVRGSLGSSLWGFDLIENSPDGAVGGVVLTQAEINAGEKIFVFIDSKGDEDWLELGVLQPSSNGAFTNRVFFKQPLADFETNQWFEIEVPASLLVEGTNSYTYFLNSAGAPNSSVFFALGLLEDLAPTVSQIISTNNAIGLQFSNLVSGLAYSVEQATTSLTDWQPALNFTASNEVETVTFPMTNSAMFYRIALPPP